MCWGTEVTTGMVLAGTAGAAITWWRGDPPAIPATLLFFALMEGLQFAGYMVIDQCGTPANRTVTLLSVLHIALQPIFINAFTLAIAAPLLAPRAKRIVMGLAALATGLILLQLLPLEMLGTCDPDRPLCGAALCTVSGDWHLAWDVPYNGLFVAFDRTFGTNFGFPSYIFAVFVMPVFYGAWRMALFHALVGPMLAFSLTTNNNEGPAIWCLFSIGILAVALVPGLRRVFLARPTPAV